MAKTKIAGLWGLLIAMMIACAGIYAALKAREMSKTSPGALFRPNIRKSLPFPPEYGTLDIRTEDISLHNVIFWRKWPCRKRAGSSSGAC